jgi:3'-phosphoadenosine 5'-phosphosulfate sulfotransferase (PAPS reductase)/FAD synthetase
MDIKEVLSKHKFPVVAFSGGKDSTVVLDLVRKIRPETVAVFCNTGVEHKLTYEYLDRIDNKVVLKPKKTFWECVNEYGFPEQKGKGKNRVNACCEWLKDKPMKEFIKKEGVDLVFTGLTSAESRQRMMFLKHYGQYMFVKSWGVWKCHPIADWTPDQVWKHIHDNHLDYNSGYDKGMVRCGCQPCTAYCSWKIRMAMENPKMLSMVLMKKLGQKQLVEG